MVSLDIVLLLSAKYICSPFVSQWLMFIPCFFGLSSSISSFIVFLSFSSKDSGLPDLGLFDTFLSLSHLAIQSYIVCLSTRNILAASVIGIPVLIAWSA